MEGLAGIISDFFNSIDPLRTSARVGQCTAAPRFRTIQVQPKDLPVPSTATLGCGKLGSTGSGGRAHGRPKTATFHHAARRSSGVAPGGARAAIHPEGSAIGHVT